MQENKGVQKFQCQLKKTPGPELKYVHTLEKWRAIFHKIGLVGETETLNYGHLSLKSADKIIITGSQTGKYPHLNQNQYTSVTSCELAKLKVNAQGPIAPSNETLTHFVIYEANAKIKFIFQIYHNELWKMMKNKSHDFVSENASIDLLEMNSEIKKMANEKTMNVFFLKGSPGEIIAYGEDENLVGNKLLATYRLFQNENKE